MAFVGSIVMVYISNETPVELAAFTFDDRGKLDREWNDIADTDGATIFVDRYDGGQLSDCKGVLAAWAEAKTGKSLSELLATAQIATA
jgi:hypothetical protein